ncbi:N-acetyl-1-D-myo-inositol-2-amino-2-deoxy-alpha-D -glucopyranoside deacetylase [Myceligenerans halotolerans]
MSSTDPSRRLLAVHAHPDDETITCGGLLRRCADAAVATTLVTCTDGRYGPVNPELGIVLDPDGLARTRSRELRDAAAVLGIDRVIQFAHHDSGMTGANQNAASQAFWSQHVDVLVREVVEVIRACRPQVVVTYDPVGNTAHPDHVQAHRVTVLAIEAAREARFAPELGEPWDVRCVLHPVYPVSALEKFIDDDLAAGLPHPYDGRSIREINYARPDAEVTHVVEIAAVYDAKSEALHAHRTQVGPHFPQLYRAALARRDVEHFRLAMGDMVLPDGFADIFRATET